MFLGVHVIVVRYSSKRIHRASETVIMVVCSGLDYFSVLPGVGSTFFLCWLGEKKYRNTVPGTVPGTKK